MFVEGTYELDLSDRSHAIITRVLVDLSVKEPGENWVDETFNGRPFELPRDQRGRPVEAQHLVAPLGHGEVRAAPASVERRRLPRGDALASRERRVLGVEQELHVVLGAHHDGAGAGLSGRACTCFCAAYAGP